jgi:3-hydroxyacyl-CoA dehydrogenase / enoyl-CoA hydratase / 3-hydroxybutyryl-CoA epimerase
VSSNILTELDGDGVLVATIDMPGRSMNVFSSGLMDSLEQLLDEVHDNLAIRAVVLRSGKSAFLAGADLEMVRTFTQSARTDSPEALHQLCGRLGRLFRRLECNGKPFVAALHGLALGGGLEVALACHERVAAEKTEVGVPEVKLGLLPGAGGTQRLPRLIGPAKALSLALRGDSLAANEAKALGILDAVVPIDDLVAVAKERAKQRAAVHAASAPWDTANWRAPGPPQLAPGSLDHVYGEVGLTPSVLSHYPAYSAIMDCVIGGWNLPMTEAGNYEMDCFVRLIRDPTAGNMIRSLFLDRLRAAKLAPPAGGPHFSRVRVLGDDSARVGALLRTARVELVERDEDNVLTLITGSTPGSQGRTGESCLYWMSPDAQPHPSRVPAVWVSDPTSYGRAVEVITDAQGRGLAAGLQVARWLRATPVVSREVSLLAKLSTARATQGNSDEGAFAARARAAAQARMRDPLLDTGIADSAAVIAGLFPAFTGGPFKWLEQHPHAHGH